MPTSWVAVPEDAVLDRVASRLDGMPRSGAVLVGADGVGKTSVARVAAERFVARQPATVVRWVAGTASERSVPFGAFGHLLEITDIVDARRPAALLHAAHDSLTADGGERLFVVDDAHDLDHMSATLVYQLALSRSARLVVTVRSGTELPEAVAALWADDLLTR
ncbi:MAG: AAA family ATPase, partial [Mycobacterium sp.]